MPIISIVPPPDVPQEYLDPLAAISDLKDRVNHVELAMTSHLDASAATSIRVPSPELLLALARVDQSLRIVLAAILEIQREMGISQSPTPDVPLKPDESWAGTP